MNRPLQIYLENAEFERLEKWAAERKWTKSQAVRFALRVLTRSPEEDPLLTASGMIDSLPEDLSQRIDSYLQETFVAEKRAPYHRGRRRK